MRVRVAHARGRERERECESARARVCERTGVGAPLCCSSADRRAWGSPALPLALTGKGAERSDADLAAAQHRGERQAGGGRGGLVAHCRARGEREGVKERELAEVASPDHGMARGAERADLEAARGRHLGAVDPGAQH